MTDRNQSEIDQEIDQLLNATEPASPNERGSPDNLGEPEIRIEAGGNVDCIQVGDNCIVDRSKTVIINPSRPSRDFIDQKQQQIIRRTIDEIAKLDSALPGAEGNNHFDRVCIANRKRWATLHRQFRVHSYKDVPRDQFESVMIWLDGQHGIALDKLNPNRQGYSGTATTLAVVLFLSVVLAAWPFVKTLLPDPPPAAIYYKVPERPVIIPATLEEESSSNLFIITGCAHCRKTQKSKILSIKGHREI
jgi:hypothetical protein